MTDLRRSFAAAIILGVVGIADVHAAPTTQPIDDAIAHLGDSDPAVRGQAVKTLRAAGESARAELEAAAAGDDPEIAGRAKEILRTAVATQPADTLTVRDDPSPQIREYHDTPKENKQQKIDELAGTPQGIHCLTRIWLTETDPGLRQAIFDALVADESESATALLGDGNFSTAELLLQAAVDRKTTDSAREYAAYWLTRGKLDERLRQWSSRGGQTPADTWAEQVLAALYRAKGDAGAAIKHAQASDDSDLLQETLIWAGEWGQLARKLHADNIIPQEPRDLALQIGADAMSGDAKAVDADVVQMAAVAHGEQHTEAAADILLLLNRPDDAVKVLIDNSLFAPAYEIMADRGQFDQAAALLAAHDKETTEEAMRLRAAAAFFYARMGLHDQLVAMSDRIAAENSKTKLPRVYVALAEAEREGQLTEKSWEHFSASVESIDENMLPWYINRAFPPKGNTVDWSALWTAAMALKPDPPVKKFPRIRKAYDQSMPLDDLETAMVSVDLSQEVARPYAEMYWETARRIKAAGREADALAMIEHAAESALDGNLYVHLGDLAADKGDWTAAATRYDAAWRKDRTQALPLYLYGLALEHLGRHAEARERMALAHVLPVGNETRRAEFIRGLFIHGLDDAMAREAEVLIRTGDPLSSSSQEALRSSAAHADDKGDFAVAAALWQRSVPDYLTASYWYEYHAQYAHLPNTIRESRARALLVAGDWAGAQREIDTCLQLLPIDSSIVIDVVPELDKLGRHEQADALFARMFATQQSLIDRYPKSAFQLNEYAWLAARCHRELDKALDAAKRAMDLSPDTVDIIDTLAEVHFQRGEFKDALELERKCVDLAPAIPFHRKQVIRFEEATHK